MTDLVYSLVVPTSDDRSRRSPSRRRRRRIPPLSMFVSSLFFVICLASNGAEATAPKDGPRGGKQPQQPSGAAGAPAGPGVGRGGVVAVPGGLHGGTSVQDRTRRLQNVSQTIEELLDGYDIRLRPQFGGETSTNDG